VGPAVVARRVLQRLVDHEGRDPGYLMGIALFAPDNAEPAARSALLAATVAVRSGMGRTTARASGMAATYLAIGMPPVSAADEIDSWNAQYGLPAAQEWILRAGIDRLRGGNAQDALLPIEVLVGAFASSIIAALAGARSKGTSDTPRQVLAAHVTHWPGASDDPAYDGIAGALDQLLYEGLPGAIGAVDGQPALRRGAKDVVFVRPDGSIGTTSADSFAEIDTAGPAPCAWYGFDAWPPDDDEPTFTSA
jgi:hypothetical protein